MRSISELYTEQVGKDSQLSTGIRKLGRLNLDRDPGNPNFFLGFSTDFQEQARITGLDLSNSLLPSSKLRRYLVLDTH